MPIVEHEFVVLTRDVSERRLQRGDVGVVVHVYGEREAYEVEFAQCVLTLRPDDIRRKDEREELHVRE